MRLVLASVLGSIFSLSLLGCGGDDSVDADPFDTFQACYDEHHTHETFTTQKAIEICCIDHPIGGVAVNMVCGDTAATCQTYVTANLMDAADTMLSADIQAACTSYVADRGK